MALTSTPLLAYPDCDKQFALPTDALQIGSGATLLQGDSNGDMQAAAFDSRKLSGAEIS